MNPEAHGSRAHAIWGSQLSAHHGRDGEEHAEDAAHAPRGVADLLRRRAASRRTRVHMFTCMLTRARAHAHTWLRGARTMHARTRARAHVHTRAHAHTHTRAHAHVRTRTRTHTMSGGQHVAQHCTSDALFKSCTYKIRLIFLSCHFLMCIFLCLELRAVER